MLIVIEDLPKESLEISGRVELVLADGAGRDGLLINDPVAYKLGVLKQESGVRVTGSVEAVVEASCSRCAKRFSIPLVRQFSEFFVAADVQDEVFEAKLDEDNLDIDYYDGGSIDGLQLLGEQIILEVPMKPLCEQNCKGLCVICGTDLNRIDCDCEPDVNPLWAPLKGLRDQL